MEVAGLAVGVAGFLFAFSGAIDGFNLIADLCSKDEDVSYAETKYHTERYALEAWGKHFNIGDEANRLLFKQPQATQDIVRSILAQINATQERALKLLKEHGIQYEPAASHPVHGQKYRPTGPDPAFPSHLDS